MGVFTMVAIIVTVSMIGSTLMKYFETSANRVASGEGEREAQNLQRQVDRLTERVKVLETIITDQDRRLKDDFRGLA